MIDQLHRDPPCQRSCAPFPPVTRCKTLSRSAAKGSGFNDLRTLQDLQQPPRHQATNTTTTNIASMSAADADLGDAPTSVLPDGATDDDDQVPILSTDPDETADVVDTSMPPRVPGFRVGFHEDRNRLNRRTMEDAHAIVQDYRGVPGEGFFAVYDGHAGRQAAAWCGENVHTVLANLLDEFAPETPIPDLFDEAFVRADKHMAEANIHAGCTAVACLVQVQEDRRILYTANVGDARAVLCRKGQAIRLSYDHKGSDPFEARRIVDAGGFMVNNRVNGVLAVTRSLGDTSMKELVVGNPYTTELELIVDDEFLILACDGIWDVLSDQEAVNLVMSCSDPQQAAEQLVHQALENMSTDNLSAIVVRFVHVQRRPSHPGGLQDGDDEPGDGVTTPTPEKVARAGQEGEEEVPVEEEA
ncbi:hypothetical protein AMAG_03214 [Allomyces macrogynus ATCC 38327]|uniref:PPM-type phosphatase domain-containing protein n=1 Tax=Allomyces macrogynus (strain ATCC 38327) TaxID=578462 RepID=A0A0L0S4R4_ALLM3|nr:hypothetical protein AMAG_03214 [Allomyces macrogynus ATCC 38327]|eukprot:KNE57508.1 hypothetical protein AMAG_03214 [Allomyces macrogynus ATCC 38327]